MGLCPHILALGSAGSGNTLLGNLMYPRQVWTGVLTDSTGVGQLEIAPGEKILKLDDATTKQLRDKGIFASYLSMFNNTWTAKKHGSKQTNPECRMFITTNVSQPAYVDVKNNARIQPWGRCI